MTDLPLPRSKPMSPPDVAWLRMDNPSNPMTITGIIGFGETMTRERFMRFVEERLVPYDRFRMHIEGPRSRRPTWVADPDFDAGEHVIDIDLPEPGGQAGLEALTSRLMSEPLGFDRAPWTAHVVHGIDEETSTAIIMRVHHTIGDGIALMHVLLSIADERFDPDTIPPPSGRPRREKKPLPVRAAKTAKGAAGETADLFLSPQHALHRIKQVGGGVGSLAGLLAMRKDSHTLFKGSASPDKRAAWTAPFSLDVPKAIGAAMGGKINDVMLAVAAGALRRYLQSEGQPVDDVEVRVAVPFNVRPLERAFELGNAFSLVFVALPTDLADPRERLAAVKARMDDLKDSSDPAVIYGILQTIGVAPKWTHRMVVKMFSEKASAVMTNVPGPPLHLHLDGVPLNTLMFWVPQAGDIGLGISILSYAGRIQVGVTTDGAYVESPRGIVEAFEAELRALTDEFVTDGPAA